MTLAHIFNIPGVLTVRFVLGFILGVRAEKSEAKRQKEKERALAELEN